MKAIKKFDLIYENYDLDYPVGSNMNGAINYVKEVFRVSIKNKLSFLEANTPINLWCRGSSGAILAALFCSIVTPFNPNVLIIHIKKKGESSHTNYVRRHKKATNIIIDDFMDSGDTIRQIVIGMQEELEIQNPIIDYLIISGVNKEAVTCYFKDSTTIKPINIISQINSNERLTSHNI